MATDDVDDWSEEEKAAFVADRDERRRERLILYESLERRLEIPVGYIDHLFAEQDDWAYIVKLAVLCEAAVTHALVAQIGSQKDADAWYEHFSDLANNRRINLALRLGIINRANRDVLDAIAQFRNSFAHDSRNLGGSLSRFFQGCSLDRKLDLSNKMLGIKHTKDQDWTFYINHTRLLIGVGVMSPIKSIAQFGLDKDRAAELQKQWMLADLFKHSPIQGGRSDLDAPEEMWDSLPPTETK